MSSESEDEFQSADEGSDSEHLECTPKAFSQSTLTCMNTDPYERVNKDEGDETYNETGLEKFNNDAFDVKEVPIVNNTKVTDYITKKGHADVSCESHEESIAVAMSELAFKSSESVEERSSDQLEVYAKDGISKLNESTDICGGKLKSGGITQECIQKGVSGYHFEEHKNDVVEQAQPKEILINNFDTDELKEKPQVSSTIVSAEDTKSESADINISGIHEERKPKAIRQSKIGMKKPREKLGERLGIRKQNANRVVSKDCTSFVNPPKYMEEKSGKILPSDQKNPDTKMDSHSTDSTSCTDSMKLMGEERDEMLNNNQECTMSGKSFGEAEEDEKSKKRQQWQEQQERWHQALNLDKDGKEVSFIFK